MGGAEPGGGPRRCGRGAPRTKSLHLLKNDPIDRGFAITCTEENLLRRCVRASRAERVLQAREDRRASRAVLVPRQGEAGRTRRGAGSEQGTIPSPTIASANATATAVPTSPFGSFASLCSLTVTCSILATCQTGDVPTRPLERGLGPPATFADSRGVRRAGGGGGQCRELALLLSRE